MIPAVNNTSPQSVKHEPSRSERDRKVERHGLLSIVTAPEG